MAKIKGVHHICIKSSGLEEFEKLVHFYRDILELPVVYHWGEGEKQGMMLDTGAGYLELFPNAQDHPGQGALRHLALATDDVDGCIEAVRAAGYEITIEPKDMVVGGVLPARLAFCIGPVGEEVEFFCEK